MDGVGEINLAKKLLSHKLMTALTKQHTIEQIGSIYKNKNFINFVALSCGTSPDSYNRMNKILTKYPKFQFICIDVANGYSENFSHFVSNVRKKYPKKTIKDFFLIFLSGSSAKLILKVKFITLRNLKNKSLMRSHYQQHLDLSLIHI